MYNAIIVGSAFGGAMAAHRLVEAGWRVLTSALVMTEDEPVDATRVTIEPSEVDNAGCRGCASPTATPRPTSGGAG